MSNIPHRTGGIRPDRVTRVSFLGNTRTIILCNDGTTGNTMIVAAGHNRGSNLGIRIRTGTNLGMTASCPRCLDDTRCVALCGRTHHGSNLSRLCSARSVCGRKTNLGPCHCPGLSFCSSSCLEGIGDHCRTATRVDNNNGQTRFCDGVGCCHRNSCFGFNRTGGGGARHFDIHNGISVSVASSVGT